MIIFANNIRSFNYEPAYTIEQICEAMKAATDLKGRNITMVPSWLLMTGATILAPVGAKKGIHPARVKKLMVSTNISGKKLAGTDYKFHYTLEESFADWFKDCDQQGLF